MNPRNPALRRHQHQFLGLAVAPALRILGAVAVQRAVRWETFEAEQADLAAAGARLLFQYGVGLGFLATE